MQKQMHSFAVNPIVSEGRRSKFDFSFPVHTTFNEGDLVPLGNPIEVLPHDTFVFDVQAFINMLAQPLKPVMDDAFIDIYAFFVPNRLLWEHWEEVHGANKSTYWDQSTEFVVPLFELDAEVTNCSVFDYLGIPPGDYNGVVDSDFTHIRVSALPLAGYAKIWNDWFRDENYQAPVNVTDEIFAASNNRLFGSSGAGFFWYSRGAYTSYVDDEIFSMPLLCVNRYHDYFSSLLPSPQKGPAVTISVGDTAPLKVGDETYSLGDLLLFNQIGGTTGGGQNHYVTEAGELSGATSTNLLVDLKNSTAAASINDIRYAFQLQRQFEKDARGGTRYNEIIRANFGVSPSDGVLQRPELIGAVHQRIGMSSVPQTNVSQDSSAGVNNATGALGAYSNTGVGAKFVTKSFTDFGQLYILAAVRVKHSYSQGIHRSYFKKRRFDYYYPTFATIGEQPVYRKELQAYVDTEDLTPDPDGVLGFQEAWAEYRYWPAQITGRLRKGGMGYFDYQAWTYGDAYDPTKNVTISSEWLAEGPANIGNATVLGGNPNAGLQFGADFYFSGTVVRAMPVNSVPGLIDHN